MLTAGIDIGSLTTKVVIMNDGNILSYAIKKTGVKQKEVLEEVFKQTIQKINIKKINIKKIVATGYGRFNVPFADKIYTEITCHAKGALYFFPKARTIMDIGGQDSKIISLDEVGRVNDFAMNDRCAAGTGRFLEVMSEALNVKLNEFGEYFLKSKKNIRISSICTVFAESEVISLISNGEKKENIIKGLCRAISERLLSLGGRIDMKEEFTLSGGVAKNKGVVYALNEKIKRVNIPFEPQITGAVGAAILAHSVATQS